ncbi:hypothetical protein FRC04_006100 [Tulasnella sp. 424]|nr:hypothetical protein FRC04_006100 [Tulasnella sp. 424]KAG8964715.1 hypothetical protein FRC05_003614 [Tulasnella sp. 425]
MSEQPGSATAPTAKPPITDNSLVQQQAPDATGPAITDAKGSLWDSLTAGNPYFSAGFGLMAVGVGLGFLRQGGLALANLAQRRLVVSLEVPSRDAAYPWFLQWIAMESNRKAAAGGPPSLRLWSNALSVETSYKKHLNGSADVLFSVVPGVGTHLFRFRGAWMQLKRERQTQMMPGPVDGRPFETLSITTLARDKHLFPVLLEEARQLYSEAEQGAMVVHTAMGTTWQRFGPPRTKRDLHSVILDDGVAERIEKDIKAFMHRSRWYRERGLPYRRGYLLHGPPGSGKSSFIQALAASLNYDLAIMNLSQRGMMDDKLNHLLLNAPGRSFILLEDIDAAFNKRVQSSSDGYQSGVTFSGLLNALDGVASAEERILFMTTNHLERLDPALIRPGRIDVTELIDDASPSQARKLFLRFYAGERDEAGLESDANEIAQLVQENAVEGRRISMAALQGHFIRHPIDTVVQSKNELFP